MRKIAVMMCFLVIVSMGVSKEVAGHTVIVSLDRAGNAHITEKYTLQLNSSEYDAFDRIAKRTSTDLSIWQLFMKDIRTSAIGDITNLVSSASTAGAGNFGNNVIVNYDIANFAVQTDKAGRDVFFEINESRFTFYDASINKFIIPWKTELQLKFDTGVRKTDVIDIVPSPSQSSMVDDRYTLFWYGSRIDNAFNVDYKVQENVGELDLNNIAGSIYTFFYDNPVYTMAVVVIFVLVIVYRKPIIGLISESFGSEEEIELPKRGV